METIRTFIFAGGGTGGHIYPGLAVAQELLRLEPGAKIVFACSGRAIDRKILDPLPYAIVVQPVQPLPHSIGSIMPFVRGWIGSARLAREMVADLKPAAVLGLGGFAAGPVVSQAARAGVPSALLNPDAVPGKANVYLSRQVQAIFTQFASTGKCFPPAVQPKVRCVGCPIRADLLGVDRAKGLEEFGLRADRKTLLVLGGSLGAASINQAIAAMSGHLAKASDGWQLLHITGPASGADLDSMSVPAGMHVRRLEYCHRMDLAYAAADLAICRSGAVTVAELAAVGLPSILLPYPYHKDQQQKLNAGELAGAGAAILCEDAKDGLANAARLEKLLLPLMTDPAGLEKMRTAARQAGKADAAAKAAGWLVGGK